MRKKKTALGKADGLGNSKILKHRKSKFSETGPLVGFLVTP